MHGPRRPLFCSLLLAFALVVALVIALPTLAFGVGADAWEDGDDLSSGATVAAPNGSLQNHTVAPTGDDEDWFRFPVVSGKLYDIKTAPVAMGAAVDTYANLYGADAITSITADDDSGTDAYSRIIWTSDYTGDAFVMINGYDAGQTGDYAFSVTEATPSSIAGTVTHGATLVGGVAVNAYLYDATAMTWDWVTSAYTDPNGTYTLPGLVAGDYRVEFDGWSVGFVYECYNNKPTFGEATTVPIVVADTAVTGIDADLAYEAVPPTVKSSVIWNNTNRACVALSAQDNSGLLSFTYQIDGEAIQTIAGASTIVTGAAAGSHTLHYVATDYAGNVTQGDVAFTVGAAAPTFAGPTFDLIFVIDTTGSMGDDIDAVKASMADIVSKIVVEQPNFRIALVDFKDYPLGSYGGPGDYPFRDMLSFTNDLGAVFTGINSLGADGGNDWPESHYAALIHSIDANTIGGWRDGGKKCVVIMTDAPPHGSDPSNVYDPAYPSIPKYTLTDVINHAMAVDPAQVFPVVVGGDSDAIAGMSAIAAGTGGVLVKADDAGGIPNALMSALSAMNDSPVAEANGPYSGVVGTPITFSSAGSTTTSGTIVSYEWDFNNDGSFDASTSATSIEHTYSSAFDSTVTVKAVSSVGLYGLDQARAAVVVSNRTPVAVADTYATLHSTALVVAAPGVLTNDTDADRNPLTAVKVTNPAHGSVTLNANGSFAYTPTAGYAGTDSFTYKANDGTVDSATATVTIIVGARGSTTLALTSSDAAPKYDTAVTLSATLLGNGTALSGQTVVFERLQGAKWIPVGTAPSGASGVATLSVKPYKMDKTTYRASFAGVAAWTASSSASVVVKPKVYLSKPNAPRAMYKGRVKTISGYLKPRHPKGSTAVRIYRYKKVGGKWKSYGYVKTRLANYKTYSKYMKSFKFTSTGKWRIRAVMGADSKHAKTYSTYDYVTVK